MSRPQEPHRPFFPFGNPFKMVLPKSSHPCPRLLGLLKTFEESLAERFRKLKPKDKQEVLTLLWMRHAMELLCQTHNDIKIFITDLKLPVSDWDDKWIDMYLNSSVRLLDICIAFSSELSRISQGHLLLQCALHNLDACTLNPMRASSSLDGWRQHISSKNPRLENCFSVLGGLIDTLNPPKVKNCAEGKVLMQAMYGVKVLTVFVCGIFAAAFSGSANKLVHLQVPRTCLWAKAFVDVQDHVNGEIRNIFSSGHCTVVLKELESVDAIVKKLQPVLQDGVDIKAEELQSCTSNLSEKTDNLSQGLDLLAKQVDAFFQIVLTGRDVLLSNLRAGSGVPDTKQQINSDDRQVVR